MQLMGHMIDFCQAIGYAHSKNIIHRDIKTENVMIDVHGQTIVLDWGLAKTISDVEYIDSSMTSTPMFNDKTSIGVVMGTPSYMSPEQAVGDIHKMDATTDVWSLGIVLFEIITGQLPFSDTNTMKLLEKIGKEDLPDVSDIEPKASKALCAILEKALQKSPSDRYQNAALLAQDLEAWYLGGTVSVYDYSWQDKFEKWFVNNRSVALVSLLGIALLMISIVIGTISIAKKNIEVKSERDQKVVGRENLSASRVFAPNYKPLTPRSINWKPMVRMQSLCAKDEPILMSKKRSTPSSNSTTMTNTWKIKTSTTCLDWQPRSPLQSGSQMMGVKSIPWQQTIPLLSLDTVIMSFTVTI